MSESFQRLCRIFFGLLAYTLLARPDTVLRELFPKLHEDPKDPMWEPTLQSLQALGLGAACCCIFVVMASWRPQTAPSLVVAVVAAHLFNLQENYVPLLAKVPFSPSDMRLQGAIAGGMVAANIPNTTKGVASMVVAVLFAAEGLGRLSLPMQTAEAKPLQLGGSDVDVELSLGSSAGPVLHCVVLLGGLYLALAAGLVANAASDDAGVACLACVTVVALFEAHQLVLGSPSAMAGPLLRHPPYYSAVVGLLAAFGWVSMLLPQLQASAKVKIS